LLMILPPGGFIAVGLILAAKRMIDARREAATAAARVATAES
jgi:Na+-translocating ferredoxin:NAD+ oxidoreductase subunit E